MGSILVIDDEELVLGMIEKVLTRFGFQVETAHSGAEGLMKFDNGSYDLVITDIMLSDMDGNRIATHIRRSIRRETPIIGTSGTPWLFNGDNFNRILAKPFHINKLLEDVNALSENMPLQKA